MARMPPHQLILISIVLTQYVSTTNYLFKILFNGVSFDVLEAQLGVFAALIIINIKRFMTHYSNRQTDRQTDKNVYSLKPCK